MRIRDAVPGDAESICAIQRELGWFSELFRSAGQKNVERVRRNIEHCIQFDSHSLFVAEHDGRVIGYAAVHWLPYLFLPGPEGYLSELFVLGSERGKGFGSQLLERVKREASERGCCRLMLVNSRTRDSYQRGFYTQRGWTERQNVANFVLSLDNNMD